MVECHITTELFIQGRQRTA